MPRLDYEERQERRRERLEARAEKQRGEATRRFAEADRLAHAMNGQPVLVGHHSEKRHRRDIDKMFNNGSKGVSAYKAAEELERRAGSVGSGGISSDDPEAIAKLKAKLEGLEASRERFKAVNAAWRKAGKPKASNREVDEAAWIAAVAKFPDLEPLLAVALREKSRDFMDRPPYSYHGSNTGAEIRRIKQRIKDLEAAAAAPEREPIIGNGWKIWEDRDENRLFIAHESKPPAEVRQALKSHGFRWNRYAGAWSRMLNEAAWRHAEWLENEGKLG